VRSGSITSNFAWSETSVSGTFPDLIEPVPQALVPRAEALAKTVLQPIRDTIARPITITSWYRPLRLNSALKGSSTSQHLKAFLLGAARKRCRMASSRDHVDRRPTERASLVAPTSPCALPNNPLKCRV
jgi:hypothetical protein